MIIYQAKTDQFKHTPLVPVREEYPEFLSKFEQTMPPLGEPVGPSWRAPEVQILRHSGRPPHKKLKEVDVLNFNLSYTAFNRRAVDTVGNMLRVTGELLPLPSGDGEFFLYNPTMLIRGLRPYREDRSLYEFVEEKVAGVDAFCMPGSLRLYVSDQFKVQYEARRLTGLGFYELWSSESGPAKYWEYRPRAVSGPSTEDWEDDEE